SNVICIHYRTLFIFFLMIRPPPRPPLFPYTTLFRSLPSARSMPPCLRARAITARERRSLRTGQPAAMNSVGSGRGYWLPSNMLRSEEHTSELQSRSDLVCRLLLEKKKKKNKHNNNKK